MTEDAQKNGKEENLPAVSARSQDVLALGNRGQLDLSSLPEAERNELKMAFAKGQIELQQKMQELGIDNQALEERIGDMTNLVAKASSAGASATVTGAYDDKMGRTEVIMGNTETAAKGKLDRSQKGERDQTLVYIVIAAIVIVIITAIIMGN